MKSLLRRGGILAVVLAAGLAACASDSKPQSQPGSAGDHPAESQPRERKRSKLTMAVGIVPGPVDPAAVRSDVDCSKRGLGSDRKTPIVDAYYVVNGELGATCLGTPDRTVVKAWNALSTITPPSQLKDLAIFAGFTDPKHSHSDEVIEAYVAAVDDTPRFQMAVNVDAFDDDPRAALFTMAHEFSHVFTALPAELDRSDLAYERCPTYLTPDGCFAPTSLIYQWIQTFWPRWIKHFDPDKDPTVAAGDRRCAVDAGFFGPYAASSPEEDFAETFSAFVFGVKPDSGAQQARLDFIAARPELVAFHDRVATAGLSHPRNDFDRCG